MSTFEYILMGLLLASVILHVIAAKTKNTYDDAAADALDAARAELAKNPPKSPPQA